MHAGSAAAIADMSIYLHYIVHLFRLKNCQARPLLCVVGRLARGSLDCLPIAAVAAPAAAVSPGGLVLAQAVEGARPWQGAQTLVSRRLRLRLCHRRA